MNVIILPESLGPDPAKESLAEAGENPQLFSLLTSPEVSLRLCKEMELEPEALFLLPHD